MAYFPGTAMSSAVDLVETADLDRADPGRWRDLGLIYSIITELTDGVAGAIAVLIVISSNWFRCFRSWSTARQSRCCLGC